MWFWFGSDLGSFLFPGYEIKSWWGLLATCLALISLAVVYEAMKVLQIKLHRKTVASLLSNIAASSENSSLLTQIATGTPGNCSTKNWYKWINWIIEVLHWSVHTTLGYLLMLAVMTFNGYVCIALVIGASFGYWIFGMTLIKLNLAQYQETTRKIVGCDVECADSVENSERRPSIASNVAEQLVAEVCAEIHEPVNL